MSDPDPAQRLVTPDGKPARPAVDTRCPQCGADNSKRRLSGGFGTPHDVCSVCGYEWQERTL